MEWQWIITGGSILLLIGAGIFCGIREWQMRREMRALEEMLDAAADRAGASEKLADTWVVLDGFTGFTPVDFWRKIMMRHVGRRSSPGWRSI